MVWITCYEKVVTLSLTLISTPNSFLANCDYFWSPKILGIQDMVSHEFVNSAENVLNMDSTNKKL